MKVKNGRPYFENRETRVFGVKCSKFDTTKLYLRNNPFGTKTIFIYFPCLFGHSCRFKSTGGAETHSRIKNIKNLPEIPQIVV